MLFALQFLLKALAILSLLCLFLGLFRPVWVLWFLDRMNRLKVIQVYGLLFLFSSLFYWLLNFISK
ncbi:hypothetical protein E4S40_15810 [Algoriphagus kandeliae]|uniref:Uncharacterized protein n=1 Tax=Algoriphagus kandeliae TaxID=2562278 RepID=A0A4Y9QP95_9BACT|nr:hypothetical protein E4S40_15810 [Algoriphagus kandeliae]